MASLAHAIRSFHGGALSHNEFLALIDRVLAADRAEPTRLLAILDEEHTNFPLPPEVYAEVQRRIEHGGESKAGAGADETRVLTDLGDSPTSPAAPPARQSSVPAVPAVPAPPAAERMKGVGDTLNGRFVLEECLGFGGMGMVYKALDLRKLEASDRKPYIAIKVLNVQFRGHPKSLIALQREAKKAQSLAHPNIVTVYDFDRDGSMVYLTMEYLKGQPLSRLLRAPDFAGMTYAQVMPIVGGMAKALAYAHQRGFVHCDFKPANVFLTDRGEVKVIDFGIARAFQKPADDAEATVFDAGSLGGLTPAYASPEMLEHREPDPRDDIYALGCITYELLTGRHPFDRLPATQARSAGIRPPRPKNLGRRPWRALRAALSFDRETRTPSVVRFLEEMSGESRATAYLVLAASTLALAALFATALRYFPEFEGGRGGEEATPATPATPAAPLPPPAARPPPPLSLAAVAPVLARVPCSALAASVRDSALHVQGYAPGNPGLARLKETLSAIPGVKSLNLDVQPVREEECGVVDAFAPYWKSNRHGGGAASIRTKAPAGVLAEGDPLIVDITTPGYDSYVNIDYYVLDGSVVHLVPSRHAKDNQAPPHYAATIGSLGNWVISRPFGSELIVLLVTPAPLFEGLRPENESRSEYLQAVEKRLGQMAGKYGREKIAADFVRITTKGK